MQDNCRLVSDVVIGIELRGTGAESAHAQFLEIYMLHVTISFVAWEATWSWCMCISTYGEFASTCSCHRIPVYFNSVLVLTIFIFKDLRVY